MPENRPVIHRDTPNEKSRPIPRVGGMDGSKVASNIGQSTAQERRYGLLEVTDDQ